MNNSAEFAFNCPDEDFPILRELLKYHVQCPASCPFKRSPFGQLDLQDAPSPLHWSRQMEWPYVLKNGDFQPHHFVLDVGGGWSILKYPVARRTRHVTCVDNDKFSMERAQETTEILKFDNISCVLGDACDLPFPDRSFDRVLMISVLEHVRGDKLKAVRECLRVLKPGGIFILTFDMVVNGPSQSNFGIDQLLANSIYGEMKMPMPRGGQISTSFFGEGAERVQVAVLMCTHTKP